MWQEVIVGGVVVAALLHVSGKYLPVPWRRKKKGGSGCGDGCDTCGSCETSTAPSAPEAPQSGEGPKHRVIKLHVQH
jgi:hypothetical protein